MRLDDAEIAMSEQPKRPMFFWLPLTGVVVAAFGVATSFLWMPAAMMFGSPGAFDEPGVVGFALYSSAGPLAALLGLVVGWMRVFMGHRASGLKWMIVLPLVWLIGLFAWIAVLMTVCGDSFTCTA